MAGTAAGAVRRDEIPLDGWHQPARRGWWVQTWRFARQKRLGTLGALIIITLLVVGTLAPWIAPYGPNESSNEFYQEPGAVYPFGTDHLGRHMLSRIIAGARISLQVSILAVLLGTGGGALIGLISGYFGGWVDMVCQRGVDILLALPGILLALTIAAALGASLQNVILAIGISIIPGAARIVRSAVLSSKENQYVEAATVIGCSSGRIMLRHVLPNVFAPILVIATVYLGNAIIIEASLSFLGMGSPPPNTSWGAILSAEGRQFLERAPWIAIFPGAAISLVVLAFNLLGDALRDVLDPRLRS